MAIARSFCMAKLYFFISLLIYSSFDKMMRDFYRFCREIEVRKNKKTQNVPRLRF